MESVLADYEIVLDKCKRTSTTVRGEMFVRNEELLSLFSI